MGLRRFQLGMIESLSVGRRSSFEFGKMRKCGPAAKELAIVPSRAVSFLTTSRHKEEHN